MISSLHSITAGAAVSRTAQEKTVSRIPFTSYVISIYCVKSKRFLSAEHYYGRKHGAAGFETCLSQTISGIGKTRLPGDCDNAPV